MLLWRSPMMLTAMLFLFSKITLYAHKPYPALKLYVRNGPSGTTCRIFSFPMDNTL